MVNVLFFFAGMVAQVILHNISLNMFMNDHPEAFNFTDDEDDE